MNKLILQAMAYSSEGTDTSDATAVAADILNGKTAYAKGEKLTGSIQSKSAATYTPTTTDQTIASGQYLSGAQTISGDANLVAGNIKDGVSIFGVVGDYSGSGGTDVSDTTAVAGDVLSGKYFHIADGTKVEGTIVSKSSADVTNSDNVVSVPAGYYSSAVSHTVGIAQAAQTITPGTTDQTITSGKYLTGDQTISGDANLVAGNIKDGTTIFGVTGSYSGGGITSYEAPAVSGDNLNFIGYGTWIPLLYQLGNNFKQQTPLNSQNLASLFKEYNSSSATATHYDLSNITIKIRESSRLSLNQLFAQSTLEKPPVIMMCNSDGTQEITPSTSMVPNGAQAVFQSASYMRTIPDNFFTRIIPSYGNTGYTQSCNIMFEYCFSLRNLPNIDRFCWSANTNAQNVLYRGMCEQCYNLDSIKVPIIYLQTISSNIFGGMLTGCYNVSSIVFTDPLELRTTPKAWSNCSIGTGDCGYTPNNNNWIYNGGRVWGQKQITDYASWELYHNDPDSYTTDVTFSKYNHDSAVETINSLPDVTLGSSNTIQFKGTSGSGYNKAISDLTAAEIAVATAKGWTVSII